MATFSPLKLIYDLIANGTGKLINRGGAKGATTAADVTSTSIDADHQALDVKVCASTGLTCTVSGTVTANIGTTNGLALDATLTGGTTKAVCRGGAKGSTSAADVTSTSVDANTQALHVQLAGQGTSGSPVRTDPTGTTTQPVSGTVTANLGTVGTTLALDATLTGGTQKSICRGGAKGATTAADCTSRSIDADHQALDTYDASTVSIDGKFPTAATPSDSDTLTNVTRIAALIRGYDGTNVKMLRIDLAGFASKVMATLAGVQQVLPIITYNSTRPAPTDGQSTSLQANTRGDLGVQEQYAPVAEDNTVGVIWGQMAATASSTNAWTEYKSGGTLVGTAGINVKSTAGRLRRIYAANTNTTTQFWLVVVNKASAPVANDVAIAAFPIPNIAVATPIGFVPGIDFGPEGKYMATGISYAISTTPQKVTLAGTSDCVVFADYA